MNAPGRFRFDSPFLGPPTDGEPAAPEVRAGSALLILNSPIQNPPSPVFNTLWDGSRFRVCADGGANRLHDATVGTEYDGERRYIPDAIRGDLDSLRPDVSSFYRDAGVSVERDPDQNSCDLDKAVQAILRWSTDGTDGASGIRTNVYIYGAFGGRFDHEMSAIQALYRWGDTFGNRLFLYDDENFALLLPPGTDNEIRLPVVPDDEDGGGGGLGEGPTCGLVPMGRRCDNVRTSGLEWDLGGDGDGSPSSLEFGSLVSTSNRVVGGVVTVRTPHPLVFTAEMRCPSRTER